MSIYDFQIHHVFALELFTVPGVGEFLSANGLTSQMKDNKVALLSNQNIVTSFQNASTGFRNMLFDAGWGVNRHDGSHFGYNQFLTNAINDIRNDLVWDDNQKKLALFDLHRFATDLSLGKIMDTGQVLSIVGDGGHTNVIQAAWNSVKLDPVTLTGSQLSQLNNYIDGFDTTLTDNGSQFNSQERFDRVEALHDIAHARGEITTPEYQHADQHVERAATEGAVTQPNYTTAAATSLIANLDRKAGTPENSIDAVVELFAAELQFVVGHVLGQEQILASTRAFFDTLAGFSDNFLGSFGETGVKIADEAKNSFNQVLAGVGGSVAGDVVEFLNVSYDAVKKGFQTGDWGDFWGVVVTYGMSAVFSAVMVTVTTTFAFAVHPIAGAIVAAGWATYGVVDALVNGSELVNKIVNDLEDVILLGAEELVPALNNLLDTVPFAKAIAAEEPTTIGPFDHLYIADTETEGLPDALTGTNADEVIWGRNAAVIEGGGGRDELHHSGIGLADGGSGDDIIILKGTSGGNANGGAGDDYVFATEANNDVLNGGSGDDWVMAFGGEGARLYGGLGSDWIVGWSGEEHLWGGDGALGPDGRYIDDGASDTFNISGGSFVHDAGTDDYVTWGFLPLTGGVQQWWNESGYAYWSPLGALTSNLGLASIVGGGLLTFLAGATDALAMTFARYAVDQNGDLVIQMAGGLLGQAVVHNYEFNSDRASTGNIEVFRVMQSTETALGQFLEFIKKAIKQGSGYVATGTDPLVIDLDGDGTVSAPANDNRPSHPSRKNVERIGFAA